VRFAGLALKFVALASICLSRSKKAHHMRVDDSILSDQVSSTASRAAESQRVQVDTSESSGSSRSSAGDRVDLSSLGGRIAQAMQGLSNQSAQRVSQLQKDYQAGRYQPDAQQIGRNIVAQLSGFSGS
jgi:hypothetical protein